MRFSLALWIRQWAQPSLFYRRRSAALRWASRWSYIAGKWLGDRLAEAAHADLIRALAASDSAPGRGP